MRTVFFVNGDTIEVTRHKIARVTRTGVVVEVDALLDAIRRASAGVVDLAPIELRLSR